MACRVGRRLALPQERTWPVAGRGGGASCREGRLRQASSLYRRCRAVLSRAGLERGRANDRGGRAADTDGQGYRLAALLTESVSFAILGKGNSRSRIARAFVQTLCSRSGETVSR